MLFANKARWYESEEAVRVLTAESGLKDAEAAILDRLRAEGLSELSLLDVGVGAGRTTVEFAPACREYVGVDYSRRLVEACRRRFAGQPWTFEVADARELAGYPADRFDVVLFSWNGLDAVGGEDDRRRALAAIRRVLRPDGWFAFSAHNLRWVPGRMRWRRGLRALRWRLTNPPPSLLLRHDAASVADERVGRLSWERHVYVKPEAQLAQLAEAGFRDAVALDRSGRPLDADEAARLTKHWVYYLCRG